MFDFGDEFILDNNRIPWLIWIQILVMFLLTFIILFTYFVLDSSPSNSLSTVSPTLENPSSCSGRTQMFVSLGWWKSWEGNGYYN
ncbi:uncharacterized protein LOC130820344 isoform X2 [Amaranthus tricolor]|uniref:uncharacterized protein LOC130820344 isoform X2 n=1 Tax=Amaranthus tricolor TaxID=29722 RepID=UPI002589B1C4|nr:uncharacterized protein LOC130820344 isoform X2 [Amaranthus tricolor]